MTLPLSGHSMPVSGSPTVPWREQQRWEVPGGPCKNALALLSAQYVPGAVLSAREGHPIQAASPWGGPRASFGRRGACDSERGSHQVKVTPGGRSTPAHTHLPPGKKVTVT